MIMLINRVRNATRKEISQRRLFKSGETLITRNRVPLVADLSRILMRGYTSEKERWLRKPNRWRSALSLYIDPDTGHPASVYSFARSFCADATALARIFRLFFVCFPRSLVSTARACSTIYWMSLRRRIFFSSVSQKSFAILALPQMNDTLADRCWLYASSRVFQRAAVEKSSIKRVSYEVKALERVR